MAVPVVVEKGTAGATARWTFQPEPGLLSQIGERSISVVAIEPILSEVGAEDVVEAVVVVVGDAHSAGPTCRSQAGLVGNVGERAIAVVPIEPICRFGRSASRRVPESKKMSIQPSLS